MPTPLFSPHLLPRHAQQLHLISVPWHWAELSAVSTLSCHLAAFVGLHAAGCFNSQHLSASAVTSGLGTSPVAFLLVCGESTCLGNGISYATHLISAYRPTTTPRRLGRLGLDFDATLSTSPMRMDLHLGLHFGTQPRCPLPRRWFRTLSPPPSLERRVGLLLRHCLTFWRTRGTPTFSDHATPITIWTRTCVATSRARNSEGPSRHCRVHDLSACS